MRPLLLITTREDETAVTDEVAAVLRYGRLDRGEVRHVRGEVEDLPTTLLDGVAAVIVTGSPFTSTDPPESKSPTQLRVEEQLQRIVDVVLDRDLPFLGACYGVSTLGLHEGATLDRRYAERSGTARVTLTDAGRADAVFGGLPDSFDAFVGHKEAVSELPAHAVLLATGDRCPVQAFRIGEHQYATQFHPELDTEGLVGRVTLYRHAGYFPPDELDRVVAAARAADVRHAHAVLAGFVDRYLRPSTP